MIDFLWGNIFNKKEKNIREVLSKNPLFSSLNNKELALLTKMLHTRSFIEGEFVFQKGIGIGMYIILSGSVNILYEKSLKKQATVISSLKVGEFFGELTLVQEKGYHQVSAQTSEESVLLGFFKPDLLNLIEKTPLTGAKILMKLGEVLGERLLKAGETLSQFNTKMDN